MCMNIFPTGSHYITLAGLKLLPLPLNAGIKSMYQPDWIKINWNFLNPCQRNDSVAKPSLCSFPCCC